MLSRRSLLRAAAAASVVPGLAIGAAGTAWGLPQAPAIRPRYDWATADPTGKLEDETDVRFLLVHHTLTPNDESPDEVPERLRAIYRFHTGERGWADVAYNFFVDPFGTVWEGRAGSIGRPVRGDATGGSQGFALLCCFLGDFTAQPPTEPAMAAMTQLLAWLAGREGIDLGAQVTFESRGSTKWSRGEQVTTPTVAAHRDMSLTECPGDALYPLVSSRLLPDAAALVAAAASPSPTPTPTPSPTPTVTPASSSPSSSATRAPRTGGRAEPGDGAWPLAALGAATLGAAIVTAALRTRADSAGQQRGDDRDGAEAQHGAEADEEPLDGGGHP